MSELKGFWGAWLSANSTGLRVYPGYTRNSPVARTHTASGVGPPGPNVTFEGIQLYSSTNTMKSSYEAIEERIQAACGAARAPKNAKITSLAREFDVPVSRLRARLQGRQPRTQRPITTKRLDDEQEAALISWIETLDALHVPPTARMVEASANAMIRRDAEATGNPISSVKMWVYEFIKRLPEGLHWVKQKPTEKERIEAEDISILQAWYDRLESLVKRIPPSNIYNFDETGFQLGQGKPQKVISRNRQRTRLLSGERGSLLTGIECIAADGWLMEPYFVAPGLVHLERWYEGGTLSEESRVAVAPSGYSNDALAVDWLHFFQEHTRNRAGGGQRLLLFDGHGSHLTWEFLYLCEQWNIIAFAFPPHTTHIVQPLDGSPFRALKERFRAKNNMIAQWGGDARDIGIFFREITGIRQQALTSRTIRKAFADRGVYPFNPAPVIERLDAARSPTPELHWPTGDTPPPPQSSRLPSSPPKSAAQARRTQGKISRIADRKGIDTDTRRQINRLSRQVIQMAEEISLLTSTVQHQLPPMPSNARKSQKRVGRSGALTTKDAKRLAAARKTKDDAASVRKGRKMAPPSQLLTPESATEEAESAETPSRLPLDPVYYFNTDYL